MALCVVGLGKRNRDWCVLYSVHCEDKTAPLLGECATRGALAVGMDLSGHIRPLSSLLPLVAVHIYLSVDWLEWGSRLAIDQPIWPED